LLNQFTVYTAILHVSTSKGPCCDICMLALTAFQYIVDRLKFGNCILGPPPKWPILCRVGR